MESKAPLSTKPQLSPPFSRDVSLLYPKDIVLPVYVRASRENRAVRPRKEVQHFLAVDLLTPRLDQLHNHLWLAGLPKPSRPLGRQRAMSREIRLTESPDEHLVWHRAHIFLKPLPTYLLSHDFWAANLCASKELYASAAGMLLSYSWLINYHSDFALAKEAGLIPRAVEWSEWTEFMAEVLSQIGEDAFVCIDRRYQYGELRLSRLNSLARYLPRMWSMNNFINQYISTSTWYQEFFERNFSWVLASFLYISVILSAMQVALATPQLGENVPFQAMSCLISVLSIAVVFLGLATIGTVWFFLFCYHFFSTVRFTRRALMNNDTCVVP
ncbi:hypothetical protein CC79DRAFT_194244 [Sarocladium strictum]